MYLNFNTSTLTFSKADGPAKPSESDESTITSSEAKNKPGKQKNMALYNQAIQLYKEGNTQVEIAKIVSRDKSTVSKWIKEHNSKPDLQ